MNVGAANALLTAPRPDVPAERVADFLAASYGLTGTLTDLAGERDQNFRLDTGAASWSVKVANAAETAEVLDMQQATLEHLSTVPSQPAFPTPLRTVDGALVATLSSDGTDHGFRVQSWLEGSTLRASAAIPVIDVGTFVAEVQHALRGFFHPAAGRHLLWDLRRAAFLAELVDHVEDGATRRLVREVLSAHLGVLVEQHAWSAQIVHNDLNPDNVVVDGEALCGAIDFGDMVHGPRVMDLAVAASYQLGTAPLEAVEQLVEGFERRAPLDRAERTAFPSLVALRLCQSIVISSWRQKLDPDNATYVGTDLAPAAAALATLATSSRRSNPGLGQRRANVLAPGLRLSYDQPLEVVSAHGVHVTDASGRVYLDAYNNVAQLGHGNEEIAAVLGAQIRKLNTNTRYLTDAVVECAERLVGLLPDALDTCYFTTSGSEANDLALRMARTVTDNLGVMITPNAYHGSTDLTFAVSPEEHGGARLAEWVTTTAAPSRQSFDDEPSQAIIALRERGFGLAAGIVDTVFSSDGIHDVGAHHLEDFAAACHDAGGLYVADEVQAGLGRVGERFWGFAAAGVVPDIVTLGKPLGNGYPIGAVVTRREIAERFAARDYFFSTFGGSSAAGAVASAVMRLTVDGDLARHAEEVGAQLRRMLSDVANEVPWLGEPRGPGMFIGIPVLDHAGASATARAASMVDRLRHEGALIGRTGPGLSVLKIRPPLIFGPSEGEELAAMFKAVVEVA